jgi:hypothetical protein
MKVPKTIRFFTDALGVNLTWRSQALGLTPYSDVMELLKRLTPHNFGHEELRIGADADGGYVVPDDFVGISECFSPGCAGYWHFEKYLEDKYQIHSHICDSEDQRPEDLGPMQDFEPYYLGPSTEGNFITLGDWVKKVELKDSTDFILQIDIESAEYLTLIATSSELLSRFRIIVIELHHLEVIKNRHAFDMLYKPFFDKLLDIFDVAHAHANNCCGNWQYKDVSFPVTLELTLHRKDRRLGAGTPKFDQSPFDVPNVPNCPELAIDWKRINSK